MKEIFQTIAQALRTGQSVALATVIRSIGSTPRHVAAKMVVRADGSFVGTIGGGSMEHKAIRDAQSALASGMSCLAMYPLVGKTPDSLGLCGGTQEVFIDVLSPRSRNGCAGETLKLFETLVDACEAGEPAALVTVVHSEACTERSRSDGLSCQVGEKILVRHDASTCGGLSGGELEPRILLEAQEALRRNRSIRLGYQPQVDRLTKLNSSEREPMEVFVDIVQPRSELLIIGAGHIGLALAVMGRILGMRVVVVDDRSDWVQRFPDVDEAIVVPYDPETETLDAIPITITPSTNIVVATWGWDEPALEQVASSPAPYIGLVASRRKAKIIFDDLLARGVPEEDLARVRVPAGLDLRAETPEEIALSIMAEMLLLERDGTGLPLLEIKGHPLALATGRVWEKLAITN
ncbi:MAG: XdhC family protein [Anaerolineae bacterium]